MEDIFAASAERMHSTLGLTIAVLLPAAGGHLQARRSGIKLKKTVLTTAEEHFSSADRAQTGNRVGPYLPLRTAQRTIGVMLLTLDGSPPNVGARDEMVLHAMAGQVALAIERTELEEQARETEVLRKADEFQRNLLNSVSHSLRSPLAAIVSAVNPIAEGQAGEPAAVVELARIAYEEACRLDCLIGNLLDMSRLEAGALKLRLEPHDITDVIGAALREFRDPPDREIRFDVRDRLPLVLIDFSLIVHTLVNLLDNAVKYSPAGSPLDVSAGRIGGEIQVCVADRGFGIPLVERDAVFGRFARGSATKATPGLGLGLPICKAFVEAHQGRISMEDRPGGGTIFSFTLPVSGVSAQSSPAGGVQRPFMGTESSS
jgi:two-component system, OmpR family, sensor histidine kinase KdpD